MRRKPERVAVELIGGPLDSVTVFVEEPLPAIIVIEEHGGKQVNIAYQVEPATEAEKADRGRFTATFIHD